MNGLRRALREAPESGVTLIELVVAASILTLVLGMVSALFINISRTTNDARASRSAMGSAQTSMYELRRVLRVATDNTVAGGTDPAVVSGSASSLTVYAFVDVNTTATPSTTVPSPQPSKVAFSVNAAGNLVETRTLGAWDGTYWTFGGTPTSRTLPGPLVIDGAKPLFAYSDALNNPLTPDPTVGLSATQRAAVASVTVTTTVPNTSFNGAADPVQLTNTIGLTNLLAGVS